MAEPPKGMAETNLPSPFRYCVAPIAYLNRLLEPVQPLCMMEHLACLIFKGEACYAQKQGRQDADKQTKDEQEAMQTT